MEYNDLTNLTVTDLDAGQIFSGKPSGRMIKGFDSPCRFTPELDPDYLFQVIRSSHFREEIKSYAHGSTQPTIPMKALRELPIDILPINQQHIVASLLGILDEKIKENERINKNLYAA